MRISTKQLRHKENKPSNVHMYFHDVWVHHTVLKYICSTKYEGWGKSLQLYSTTSLLISTTVQIACKSCFNASQSAACIDSANGERVAGDLYEDHSLHARHGTLIGPPSRHAYALLLLSLLFSAPTCTVHAFCCRRQTDTGREVHCALVLLFNAQCWLSSHC